jgi:hypothetical protein
MGYYGEINSRDLDNYITGHYGEDQFRDEYPEEDIAPPDDSVCLNGNGCDIPNCPEHGDDQDALDAAESEGMISPEDK